MTVRLSETLLDTADWDVHVKASDKLHFLLNLNCLNWSLLCFTFHVYFCSFKGTSVVEMLLYFVMASYSS